MGRTLIASVLVSCWLLAGSGAIGQPRSIVSDEQASDTVSVRIVSIRNGAVSGLITNRTSRPLRDIRLLIRYQWVWRNEREQGADNPGQVVYSTVHQQIPPEVSVAFQYQPDSPLPSRSDGHFETAVEVVGYTEVGN